MKQLTQGYYKKAFARTEKSWGAPVEKVSNVLRDHAVSRITRLSAVDTVRARIAMAIELGLLLPGERLPKDNDIAAALEVSTITVRRALASLALDLLVIRRRGKTGGTFVGEHPPPGALSVATVYREDKVTVDRLIDERTLIESALVSAAATSSNLAAVDALQGFIDEGNSASDWAAFHRADEKFHIGLVDASGLEWAREIHSSVLGELYQYFVPYPIEYLRASNGEHQRIVDSIRGGNVARAAAECQAHIQVLHDTMYTGLKPPGK
jgi:DNA-binding FadR family transcriptional regulator